MPHEDTNKAEFIDSNIKAHAESKHWRNQQRALGYLNQRQLLGRDLLRWKIW